MPFSWPKHKLKIITSVHHVLYPDTNSFFHGFIAQLLPTVFHVLTYELKIQKTESL